MTAKTITRTKTHANISFLFLFFKHFEAMSRNGGTSNKEGACNNNQTSRGKFNDVGSACCPKKKNSGKEVTVTTQVKAPQEDTEKDDSAQNRNERDDCD